ncbi:MAG: HAD family phosphatase [Bryobacterales bacterium]|nr:HAD family phosphatase [Bryobacterales bacterium]
MKEPRAILFDFDGVLVDSEPVHHIAWSEALAPLGVSISAEVYLRQFTGIEDRGAIEWLASVTPAHSFEVLWATFPRKQEVFLERMLAEPLVPEASAKLLEQLKLEDYRLAVVSSSSGCEVWPILERNGVRHLFDLGVFAEDVAQKKPHPEPYRKALSQLGVHTALVLEDSSPGMASATAAGCEVIQVTDVNRMATQVREHLALGNPWPQGGL